MIPALVCLGVGVGKHDKEMVKLQDLIPSTHQEVDEGKNTARYLYISEVTVH